MTKTTTVRRGRPAGSLNKKTIMNEIHRKVDLMKVMGNPTRLRILTLLGEGEQNVDSIGTTIEKPQTDTSLQLRKLRDNGLVKNERRGVFKFYSLTEKGAALMEMIRSM